MAVVAQRHQVLELVLVAAFGKRNDVMNLELVGRPTLAAPFAVSPSRRRSRLLPTRGVAGTAFPRMALVVGSAAGTAAATYSRAGVVVLSAVQAELEQRHFAVYLGEGRLSRAAEKAAAAGADSLRILVASVMACFGSSQAQRRSSPHRNPDRAPHADCRQLAGGGHSVDRLAGDIQRLCRFSRRRQHRVRRVNLGLISTHCLCCSATPKRFLASSSTSAKTAA